MTRTARLRAFAKLNLGLRVLYKRPDGFHELRTVFQTISLADRLDVSWSPARRTEVTVVGSDIADNIVIRAAHLVLQTLKIQSVITFHLNKNIPSGAGLGGGSSDAAAVLLSLPVLAGKNLAPECLANIAAQLGSDVPFFLRGGTALGIGRGEELYALSAAPARNVLLIAPVVHSSTAEAYRDLSATLNAGDIAAKLREFQGDGRSVNDFEPPVFARHPELRRICNRLRREGAVAASMTGSGSALFGIFESSAAREKARAAFPGERSYAVSFLSQARYQAAWTRALQPHTKGNEWPPRSLYAR